MKKLLLSVFLFIIYFSAQAQCKYLSKEVDEFTGYKTVTTIPITVQTYKNKNEKGRIDFAISSAEGNKYIVVQHRFFLYYDNDLKCLTQESKLLIKKKDGTLIELPSANNFTCSEGGVVIGAFLIDDSQLKSLSSGADKFRIYYSKSFLDGSFGSIEKTYGFGKEGPDDYNSKNFFYEAAYCMGNGLADLGTTEPVKQETSNEDW